MTNRTDHWCQICRMPIKSKPHVHCQQCQAGPEFMVVTPSEANRWGMEIYYHTCKACGNTWNE